MTRGKQKIEAQKKNVEKNQKSKGSQFEARAVGLKITCTNIVEIATSMPKQRASSLKQMAFLDRPIDSGDDLTLLSQALIPFELASAFSISPEPCRTLLEVNRAYIGENFSTEIIESISPENLQLTVKLCVDGLQSPSIALKRSAAAKLANNRADNRALIGESVVDV